MVMCEHCGLDERTMQRLEDTCITLAVDASDTVLIEWLIDNKATVVQQDWEGEFNWTARDKHLNIIGTGKTWRESVNNAMGVEVGVKG